jgi:uncharacterized protein
MDITYAITPLLAWLFAGSLKFIISSLRSRQWAIHQVGYGGFPSNHSAIVSSAAALIMLREGIGHPAFGVAIALVFIVIIDANNLRKQIGRHAAAINAIRGGQEKQLRERMGHSWLEISAGIGVGVLTAWLVALIW